MGGFADWGYAIGCCVLGRWVPRSCSCLAPLPLGFRMRGEAFRGADQTNHTRGKPIVFDKGCVLKFLECEISNENFSLQYTEKMEEDWAKSDLFDVFFDKIGWAIGEKKREDMQFSLECCERRGNWPFVCIGDRRKESKRMKWRYIRVCQLIRVLQRKVRAGQLRRLPSQSLLMLCALIFRIS